MGGDEITIKRKAPHNRKKNEKHGQTRLRPELVSYLCTNGQLLYDRFRQGTRQAASEGGVCAATVSLTDMGGVVRAARLRNSSVRVLKVIHFQIEGQGKVHTRAGAKGKRTKQAHQVRRQKVIRTGWCF